MGFDFTEKSLAYISLKSITVWSIASVDDKNWKCFGQLLFLYIFNHSSELKYDNFLILAIQV